MKKYLSTIVAAAACLLVLICLFQIAELKQQIVNLESNISSRMSNVERNVGNGYSRINSRLEAEASLLADSSWSYGEVKIAERTADVICTVTPKAFSPADTTAIIVCNGAEYPMVLQNGEYTASVPMPLISESVVSKVMFSRNGITSTETLNWYISPRYELLPNIYANMTGSATGSTKDGVYIYRCDGGIEISADSGAPFEIKSATLLELLDGAEIGRTQIDLNSKARAPESGSGESSAPTPVSAAESRITSVGKASSSQFYHALNKEYNIPFGSTLELYVEVVDGYDLHYRVMIDRQMIDGDGQHADDEHDWYWRGAEASIYDNSGEALFTIE